jgi:hypothetical protein
MVTEAMFLRAKIRKKDGKQHRYFSVVENRRVGQNKTAQRTVLYLGEINDNQEAVWRQTLEVFDENHQQYTTLSLFPDDREIPAEASDSIQVKLSEMVLRRPRAFGNCWLGCVLWRQLRLEEFLGREDVGGGAARNGALGEGAAVVGGQSVDRSGQRVSRTPTVVRSKCDGGVVGGGLRGSRKRSTLSLLGSHAGAQASLVSASAGAMAGLVPGAV